jgi:hypothetical protein
MKRKKKIYTHSVWSTWAWIINHGLFYKFVFCWIIFYLCFRKKRYCLKRFFIKNTRRFWVESLYFVDFPFLEGMIEIFKWVVMPLQDGKLTTNFLYYHQSAAWKQIQFTNNSLCVWTAIFIAEPEYTCGTCGIFIESAP